MNKENLVLCDVHFSADGTQTAMVFKSQEGKLIVPNCQSPAEKTIVLQGIPVAASPNPMIFAIMCLSGVVLKQQEAIEDLKKQVQMLSEAK